MILYNATQNSNHAAVFRWYFDQPRNYYLFVLYHVPTNVRIDDSYVTVPAESCVIFDKTTIQDYYPAGDHPFSHDFMHFDLDSEADRLAFDGIPLNTPFRLFSPDKISGLLKTMMQELYTNAAHSATILSQLGQAFLYMVKDELQIGCNPVAKDLHFDTLYQLRQQIYLYPARDWSVMSMSRQAHLSPSHLQSLYRSFFHTSCARDVIRARIQMAKSLLQYTALSVHAISESCGYKNTEHFIRQFKDATDLTPLQFRKRHHSQDP